LSSTGPAAGEPPPTAGTTARRAARQGGATRSTGPDRPSGRSSGGRPDRSTRRRLDPDALAALEEERDFLLTSLADLEREHDAGDVDDTDYAELKDDYTARTAAVLRAIDARQSLADQTRPPRSWGRIALWGAVVVLFAVLGGVLVAQASGNRTSGDTASGDIRLTTRDLLLRAQEFTGLGAQQLQGGDPEAALDFYRQAIETYQEVLEIQPANVEALTYQGWVLHTLALSSDPAAGEELDVEARNRLDEAIAVDPTYADARVFRAILSRNAGDLDAARADLDAVPPDAVPAFMTQMVAGLRQSLDPGA
jgi:tetratricopeptide (TPR) repeat protein